MNEEVLKTLTVEFGTLAGSVASLVVSVHGASQAIHGLEQMVTAPAKALAGLRSAVTTFQQTVSRANSAYANTIASLSKTTLTVTQALAKQKDAEEARTKSMRNAAFDVLGASIGAVVTMFATLVAGAGSVIGGLIQLGVAALPGGLETFGQVISYVSTVVGTAFAPAMVLLMAGLVTLADMLRGPILDGVAAFLNGGIDQWLTVIEDWIGRFIEWAGGFISGAKAFMAGLYAFIETIAAVIGYLASSGPTIGALAGAWFGSVFGPLGTAIGAFVGWLLGMLASVGIAATIKEAKNGMPADKISDEQHRKNLETRAKADNMPPGWVDEQLEKEKKEKAAKGPSIPGIGQLPKLGDVFDKAKIKDALKGNVGTIVGQLGVNQAKNANLGFSGIADVQRQIQMQAFQSELDARKLAVQEQSLKELQEMNQKLGGKEAVAPPTRK